MPDSGYISPKMDPVFIADRNGSVIGIEADGTVLTFKDSNGRSLELQAQLGRRERLFLWESRREIWRDHPIAALLTARRTWPTATLGSLGTFPIGVGFVQRRLLNTKAILELLRSLIARPHGTRATLDALSRIAARE